MNILVDTNIRCITTHILPGPPRLINVARIPNRSIQKHGLVREILTVPSLFRPHNLPINEPLDLVRAPLDHILVEPIGAVETQLVNALPITGAGSVVVSLHDGLVLAQELEVDLVLRFVTLEGGEVEVEVEAAGVACRTLNEGAEGAVEEPRSGAPPSAAAVVEGEGDGVGVGAVAAGFWGVVYGDLFEELGFWVESWISHCCFHFPERERDVDLETGSKCMIV